MQPKVLRFVICVELCVNQTYGIHIFIALGQVFNLAQVMTCVNNSQAEKHEIINNIKYYIIK